MTFYIKPPTGHSSYKNLEEFALNRLIFLLRLHVCSNDEEKQEVLLDAEMVNWSDCLIAGTVEDKISHYILRRCLVGSPETSQFFCHAETIFFRLRLDSFSDQEWMSFFNTLRKYLRQCENEKLTNLYLLYNSLSTNYGDDWMSLVKGIKDKDDTMHVHLPFQLVLSLVAKRRVSLNQGFAEVPLSLMHDVLEESFYGLLTFMIQQTTQEIQKIGQDVRMLRLSAVLKRSYEEETHPRPSIPLRSKALTLDSLTLNQIYFPPCMSQLMSQLKKHHRLCHNDRIQLTLFLKEIGLPIHEALLFWKREYSKPRGDPSHVGCQHDWQGNERRYIYNIRHLYGLEGKRVSYTAHGCGSIQDRQLTCTDRGGCPFAALEMSELNHFLQEQSISEPDIEDILLDVKNKNVEKACGLFTCYKARVSSGIACGDNCMTAQIRCDSKFVEMEKQTKYAAISLGPQANCVENHVTMHNKFDDNKCDINIKIEKCLVGKHACCGNSLSMSSETRCVKNDRTREALPDVHLSQHDYHHNSSTHNRTREALPDVRLSQHDYHHNSSTKNRTHIRNGVDNVYNDSISNSSIKSLPVKESLNTKHSQLQIHHRKRRRLLFRCNTNTTNQLESKEDDGNYVLMSKDKMGVNLNVEEVGFSKHGNQYSKTEMEVNLNVEEVGFSKHGNQYSKTEVSVSNDSYSKTEDTVFNDGSYSKNEDTVFNGGSYSKNEDTVFNDGSYSKNEDTVFNGGSYGANNSDCDRHFISDTTERLRKNEPNCFSTQKNIHAVPHSSYVANNSSSINSSSLTFNCHDSEGLDDACCNNCNEYKTFVKTMYNRPSTMKPSKIYWDIKGFVESRSDNNTTNFM